MMAEVQTGYYTSPMARDGTTQKNMALYVSVMVTGVRCTGVVEECPVSASLGNRWRSCSG